MEGERIVEPLLYLDQPTLAKPKAYMQESYFKPTSVQEEDDTFESFEPKKNVTNDSASDSSDSSFKDLTIEEKITYLVDLPNEVPSIRCEVETDKQKYRGIITDYVDDEIKLKIFGREDQWLHKEEIVNIHLIGF